LLKGNVHGTPVNTLTIYTFVVHFVERGRSSSKKKPRFDWRFGHVQLEQSPLGESKATEVYRSPEVPRIKPPGSEHVGINNYKYQKIIMPL
jgi:hypothetical protein